MLVHREHAAEQDLAGHGGRHLLRGAVVALGRDARRGRGHLGRGQGQQEDGKGRLDLHRRQRLEEKEIYVS